MSEKNNISPQRGLSDEVLQVCKRKGNQIPMEEILRKPEIKRITRDLPPADYLFNIESFSLLVNTGLEKYECQAFEAGGYTWRLSLYPNGNKKSNGIGFISLYLQIEKTEYFPPTWEVDANIRFFLLDQIREKYLTIEEGDGAIKRFYQMKTEWGIAQVLSLDHFNDASNGYLVDDCCTFGVEIFVHKRTGKLERLSMVKQPPNNKITFKLQNYSKSFFDSYASDVQTTGDSKWKLVVYPRGKRKDEALSVYLVLVEASKLPPKGRVYAEYKFRVKDPSDSIDSRESATVAYWFTAESSSRGYPRFMPLWELVDYIEDDTLVVEVEIIIVSKGSNYAIDPCITKYEI